jgi:hypothetical protein
MISEPVASICDGVKPFTVARVPTGINAGVLNEPCGVVIVPVLAAFWLQES